MATEVRMLRSSSTSAMVCGTSISLLRNGGGRLAGQYGRFRATAPEVRPAAWAYHSCQRRAKAGISATCRAACKGWPEWGAGPNGVPGPFDPTEAVQRPRLGEARV